VVIIVVVAAAAVVAVVVIVVIVVVVVVVVVDVVVFEPFNATTPRSRHPRLVVQWPPCGQRARLTSVAIRWGNKILDGDLRAVARYVCSVEEAVMMTTMTTGPRRCCSGNTISIACAADVAARRVPHSGYCAYLVVHFILESMESTHCAGGGGGSEDDDDDDDW
jgi:hypothetical protein